MKIIIVAEDEDTCKALLRAEGSFDWLPLNKEDTAHRRPFKAVRVLRVQLQDENGAGIDQIVAVLHLKTYPASARGGHGGRRSMEKSR